MNMKSKDFDWKYCKEIAILTSVEVIYAVKSSTKDSWSFVKAGFGVANKPEQNVQVIYTEEWHPWPF